MRSFIAIELPESVRAALAELQQELKKCGADIRWVRSENIHLTLKFLGDIEEKDVAGILEKIKGTCSSYQSIPVEIAGVGVFPNIRAPRVLWAGVESEEMLARLHLEMDKGLASLGFKQENRTFAPHLTLGRFKSFKNKAALADKLDLHKGDKFGSIEVISISLMKSVLSAAGPKYSRLAEIYLGNKNF